MFYYLRRSLLFFFGLAAIFVVHTMVNYLLPFPFNQINTAFLTLMWLVVYRNDSQMLWMALGVTFLMNIFSSSPFGLLSISVITALLAVRKLFFVVFTNYSWYNVLLLGLVGYIFYKTMLYLTFVCLSILNRSFTSIALPNVYASLFEIGVNAAVFLCIYAVASLITPKKRYYNAF